MGGRGVASPSVPTSRPPVLTATVLLLVAAFVAWQVQIGADAMWPVALGRYIVHHGIPHGVPYAAADSSGWANVPVLGELVLTALAALGTRGLAAFQIGVDVIALGLLALAALRRGASDARVALALALAVLAAAPALIIIRLQVLSLLPFALLLLLLHHEYDRPSARIWLVPVLVAVWTNLHGAVLLGVAVAGSYLLFSRLRVDPRRALAVGALTGLTLLVTPAGPGTIGYYVGVFGNEAAARGQGLWARPSLTSALDVAMLVGLVGLLALTLRRRQPLWTYVVALGLGLATVSAVRNGAWLGMALVLPAVVPRGVGGETAAYAVRPVRRAGAVALVGWLGVTALVVTGVLMARSRPVDATPPALVSAVREVASGRAVLAPEPLVERLAADGLTIWVANPIDAFSRTDQARYLDFLDGRPGGRAALDAVHVVVVEAATDPERLVSADPRWRIRDSVDGWTIYTR